MRRGFLSLAAALAASFTLAACGDDETRAPATNTPAQVEIDLDFDAKTKTVTVPPPTLPTYRAPATTKRLTQTVAKPPTRR